MITVNYAEYIGAKVCCAKNDIHYYLNGFFFDEKGLVVSTDGHRLFCGKADVPELDADKIVNVKGKSPSKFSYVTIDSMATYYDDKNNVICQLPVKVIDGRYPDWRRVANINACEVKKININLDYLVDAAKVGKAFGGKYNHRQFEFQDSNSAFHIKYPNDAFMVIMPVRDTVKTK